MDWKECCYKRLAKKVSQDLDLAKSMLESSNGKYFTASSIKIKPKTASSAISLFYDSLREMLEAVAVKKGYKIYNHECYTWFIKEVLGEEEFASEFDRIRKIRNSINYYGRKLAVEDAVEIKKEIKKLREKAKKLL